MSDAPVFTVRPRLLRVIAVVVAIGLTALALTFWFALPDDIRALFTVSQMLTLLAVLAFLVAVVVSVGASYVRADESGLVVRNGFRRHVIPWARVHKIILRPADPWALLLLKPSDGRPFEADLDADKRMLMGIQAGDGAAAEEAVVELTARLTRSRAT